ncbi:MAG: copper chaperone PCu(A)C [Gammaproteobacteria bacterium]|nr:copper chaperone PCu(A)C [Gammaproteobacteria bacterium]
MQTRTLQVLLGSVMLAISLNSLAECAIKIQNAWIREGPPTATVLAAYLEVENLTNTTLKLIGTESPSFERVEIHRTEMKNGIATMHRYDSVILAPNSQVIFSPGDYHLMLIGPKGPLHAGDTVKLELTFDGGSTIPVTATVRKAPPHNQ